MITKFGCKNIKAIKDYEEIEIRPITIIMGENSSGKSSLLQALSLLSVTQIYGNNMRRIKYDNPFSNFEDINTFKNKGEDVTLFYEIIENNEIFNITLVYKDDLEDKQYGVLKSIKIDNQDMIYSFTLNESDSYSIDIEEIKNTKYNFLENVNMTASSNLNAIMYIDDSTNHYNISEILFKYINILADNLKDIRHVGMLKDVTASYDYPNDYIGYFGEKYKDIAKSLSSKLYINKAIKHIFKYDIKKIDKDTGEFYLSDNKINKTLGLNMFGSSVKSTIPILTQYAINREKEIKEKYRLTIIEEPEINEHPQSQARLIESLFPKTRPKKHFNIIETHSDHILNKIRFLVSKKVIKSQEVVVYYKEKDSNFQKIEINKCGEFKQKFPKGFYDATLNDIYNLGKDC